MILLYWLRRPATAEGAEGSIPSDLATIREPTALLRGTLVSGGGVGQPLSDGGTSMAMRSTKFHVGQGDRLPILSAQLLDDVGDPIPLAGCTVRFSMRDADSGTVKINRQLATVVDADSGEVEYAWAAGDTDTASIYEAEWEITDGDGLPLTVPNRAQKLLVIVAGQIA